MAIKLENKTNVTAPTVTFPYGAIKDETTQGANDGTPISETVYQDMHQFFAKMMAEGGAAYTGTVDNGSTVNDFYNALQLCVTKRMELNNFITGRDADNKSVSTSSWVSIDNGNIGLPTDGITRSFHVTVKGVWETTATAVSGDVSECSHRLTKTDADTNVTVVDETSLVSYVDTGEVNGVSTVLICYFQHAGDGGSIEQEVKKTGSLNYNVTNIKINAVGIVT